MLQNFCGRPYYALRAFFEPHQVRTDRVPGQPDLEKDGLVRVYDADLNAPTHLFVRGNEAMPDKSQAIVPKVPDLLGGSVEVTPVDLPLEAQIPDRRPFILAEKRAESAADVEKKRAELDKARCNATSAILSAGLDSPQQALVKYAAAARSIAELDLAEAAAVHAEARHLAFVANLDIELLEESGKKDAPEWQAAARALVGLQRRHSVTQARLDLCSARFAQLDPKQRAEAEKKLAAAQMALADAEKTLASPLDTSFSRLDWTKHPATSTGRRLALARWIAQPQNPLTARVAANHLWLRHFGKPLVPTVFDFGRNGQPPSHPALLDWLAAELMESGVGEPWRMKRLHRLIVTSAAYRRDSTPEPKAMAVDPENKLLWRFAPRRLEAESVRDSVLAVAGNLDRAMGGPDLDHNAGLTLPRRSLYFRSANEKQMTFLTLFDGPNVTECYQRTESVAPQQALALANSSLTLAQGRLLARKLHAEQGEAAGFVTAAYERLMGRLPSADELSECVRFLEEQAKLLQAKDRLQAYSGTNAPVLPATDPVLRAREDLVHVLLNHHEFVTIR